MLGGAFAIEQDIAGDWVFDNNIQWAVDVTKHIR